MRETVKFAVKVKQGFYSKQEPETFCFEKGDMVVLLRTNGTFVTAYTKANSIKAHLALEEREWYKNMKIRFDITE